MNIKIRSTSKIKVITVMAVILFVGAAGGVGYAYYKHQSSSKVSTTTPAVDTSTINYSPPTTEEKAAANEQKAQDVAKQNAAAANTTPPSMATVVETSASYNGTSVIVRGYISNIIETGGVCTAKLTQNGVAVTGTSTANADATTTQCPAITFSKAQLANGDWQAVLSYSSSTATGQSTTLTVTVGS